MYVLLALLAVQQPAPPSASPVSDTAHVVIVATTDVHGRVLGWDYVRDARGLVARRDHGRGAAGPIPGAGRAGGRGRPDRRQPVRRLLCRARFPTPPPGGGCAERDAVRRRHSREPRVRLRAGRAGAGHRRRDVPLRLRQRLPGRERYARVSSLCRRHAGGRENRDYRPHDARRDGVGPERAGRSDPGSADRGGRTARLASPRSGGRRSQGRSRS